VKLTVKQQRDILATALRGIAEGLGECETDGCSIDDPLCDRRSALAALKRAKMRVPLRKLKSGEWV
jgi:hypothetical protein